MGDYALGAEARAWDVIGVPSKRAAVAAVKTLLRKLHLRVKKQKASKSWMRRPTIWIPGSEQFESLGANAWEVQAYLISMDVPAVIRKRALKAFK